VGPTCQHLHQPPAVSFSSTGNVAIDLATPPPFTACITRRPSHAYIKPSSPSTATPLFPFPIAARLKKLLAGGARVHHSNLTIPTSRRPSEPSLWYLSLSQDLAHLLILVSLPISQQIEAILPHPKSTSARSTSSRSSATV
jgi:hypothetical protein